ncbi:ATP phosphoribosyltransferase regulatory subunit [Saccharococcus caldoxylosilyticus]|uniref:ATP phosphoribosyltransferase regulatory subunit n=1 Tax=Saccharococcus caldoxylosilyticus TaxID=81408 RepID=UPI001FCB595D|nr:ATP phosphoribosyltransferase regulatory subunit [Parageobacillus caldoxylosilyticus]BDG37441.1 ATP phosphoribosyltransferase regulatory subunit [Parageobacillus caldoxylosilyticus]BDG41232.1 ATP phosphoribosyltransferase regulatory subunit [Parageobacillus caldoxylosilyticus]
MSKKLFMFEKPLGMRDTLPFLYEMKKRVRQAMADEIEKWGYEFIETPTLEYYETVGSVSAIADHRLFKLLDQQGHTLVLRPDMTTPIARLAASRLYKDGNPLRLAYNANVFRAQQREGGRPAEFEQIGIECIGDGTIAADAEVISLMIAMLKRAGLQHFTVTIGHIGYVNALFLEILGNEERASVLRRFLYEKNYVGYREHVQSLPLSSIDQKRLLQLLSLRGSGMMLEEAKEVIHCEEGKRAAEELAALLRALDMYRVADVVKFDLTLVSHMSYYTGILFEVYAEQVGFPIGNGGRYDDLLEKFARKAPATGFGIRVDRLIEALGESEAEPNIECIVFSQERFAEAIELADAKRREGKRVVLQHISGIRDIDAYSKRYPSMTYLLGSKEKE